MLTKITNNQLSLIGIFSLVFLFSASETITLIAVEENANIFFKICIFLIVIFIFQVTIITFAKFNHYILSFLSVINVISLKLIYIKGIFSLKDYQQLILFLFFYFNFLILYKYYQKNLLFKRIAVITLSILITIPILLNIFNIYSFGNTNLYKQSVKQFFSWTLSNQGKRLKTQSLIKKRGCSDSSPAKSKCVSTRMKWNPLRRKSASLRLKRGLYSMNRTRRPNNGRTDIVIWH